MKPASFIIASATFWLAIGAGYTLITFQCGMGPDSPSACNDLADQEARYFLIAMAAIYLAGLAYFLRKTRTGT